MVFIPPAIGATMLAAPPVPPPIPTGLAPPVPPPTPTGRAAAPAFIQSLDKIARGGGRGGSPSIFDLLNKILPKGAQESPLLQGLFTVAENTKITPGSRGGFSFNSGQAQGGENDEMMELLRKLMSGFGGGSSGGIPVTSANAQPPGNQVTRNSPPRSPMATLFSRGGGIV